jgi:hypothetical protein
MLSNLTDTKVWMNPLTPSRGQNSPSEMLVPVYQTTQCHTPEDSNLNPQCCENLNSH